MLSLTLKKGAHVDKEMSTLKFRPLLTCDVSRSLAVNFNVQENNVITSLYSLLHTIIK